MKIRVKFAKRGSMKFVGHLDVMRYFQKAIKRAEIDIAYSGGFSPHQILSFASPLGIGCESEGEYLDMECNQVTSSKEMLDALQSVMTEEFEILSVKKLGDKTKNAMASVAGADYKIAFREGYWDKNVLEQLEQLVSDFYNQSRIVMLKKTKKSEKEVDIRPMIYSMEAINGQVNMQLACGSAKNLKPELVMESFYRFCQNAKTGADNNLSDELLSCDTQMEDISTTKNVTEWNPLSIMVTRMETYGDGADKTQEEAGIVVLKPLDAFGEEF